MLVYRNYDTEVPELVHYTGDRFGALRYAMEEGAFEVDIYEGTSIHPDAKCVGTVMYNGMVLEVVLTSNDWKPKED